METIFSLKQEIPELRNLCKEGPRGKSCGRSRVDEEIPIENEICGLRKTRRGEEMQQHSYGKQFFTHW